MALSTPVFEARAAARLRRNRARLAAAASPFLVALVSYLLFLTGLDRPMTQALAITATIFGPIFGSILLVRAWLANRGEVAVVGELCADADGVSFAGRRLAARAELRAGFVVATAEGAIVELTRGWPRSPLRLRVRDEAEGRALLLALGLDVTQAVARFGLPSLLSVKPRLKVGFGAALALVVAASLFVVFQEGELFHKGTVQALLGDLFTIFGLLIGALIVVNTLPARVIVGADGVVVSWCFRKRFIPFRDIVRVAPFEHDNIPGVKLELAQGEPVLLPVRILDQDAAARDVQRLAARIAQAMESASAKARAAAALPARGERSMPAWIRSLRGAGAGALTDHRVAPIDAEALWSTVEDAASPPLVRVAAAIALGDELDGEGRARLRIASQATAAPELRAALDLAAEAEVEEEELARALQRLEAL